MFVMSPPAQNNITCCIMLGTGHVGLASEGGGVNRAPKIWGGGGWEKGSIDRHH